MKTFPYHPATMELHFPEGEIELELERNFTWKEEAGHNYSYWVERDTGDALLALSFAKINQDLDGYLEAVTPAGTKVIVRRYDEYDPVRMGVSAIPWPKSAAQDWMIGEGPMTLNALVDDNGDVATLLLDSPSANHLRYTGAWYLLQDIDAISDYDVVEVEDTALDLYDPADQTGKSVKITSMPVTAKDDFRVQVRYSGEPDAKALEPLLTESITAAGELQIPVIATARDLPGAVDFAVEHPEFQWYVERRAKALRTEMKFPW